MTHAGRLKIHHVIQLGKKLASHGQQLLMGCFLVLRVVALSNCFLGRLIAQNSCGDVFLSLWVNEIMPAFIERVHLAASEARPRQTVKRSLSFLMLNAFLCVSQHP